MIGEFHTRNSNTPGYYIVQWKGNVYTLQEQYTSHAFDPSFIIPEVELVFPDKFCTPTSKYFYWYYEPDKAIPVMAKLKQVVIP